MTSQSSSNSSVTDSERIVAALPILVDGTWREARASSTFRAVNPSTGELLPGEFPISQWPDVDVALTAAKEAARSLREGPPERTARFLDRFAERLDAESGPIVDMAHLETALARTPRLADVELKRTTAQLRQAAAAAREGSWALPTIDTRLNIRSCFAPIGPVVVFGPNNFPLAFNSASGGDFAAAIAAGNPVVAKGHPSHPGTTRLVVEQARAAIEETGMPVATVQLIYDVSPEDGLRLVADPRLGAAAFTGSRASGLALKAAADRAGKPIYVELSSLNPVVILPGALKERLPAVVDDFVASALLAGGQMCTNPGLVLLLAGDATERFIDTVRDRFDASPPVPLLSTGVAERLAASVAELKSAGATLVAGGEPIQGPGARFANTLLRVDGERFLAGPARLQTEAFGNAVLIVVAGDVDQAHEIIETLEGNLTGALYSDSEGSDDETCDLVATALRRRVGRLLNDKMPTGVAVSPGMNHGGPFPATGHPGFTAVGIPAAMRRFAVLQCWDSVRQARLPAILRDQSPGAGAWRSIDGRWTQENALGGP